MTKCEQIRTLMMDYLYDELSKDEREAFISHIEQCNECREEVESLKTTSGVLQQWGEVENDIRVIAVKEKSASFIRIKEFIKNHFLKPKKLAFGFTGAFAVVFLFLVLTNTEISINDGKFNMRMSLFDQPEQKTNIDFSDTNQLVAALIRENLQLTHTLIKQSEKRQRQELTYILLSFKKEIDEQRYQDLNLIQYGFKDLETNTYYQIKNIDSTLNKLIHPADIRY